MCGEFPRLCRGIFIGRRSDLDWRRRNFLHPLYRQFRCSGRSAGMDKEALSFGSCRYLCEQQ